jgi:hypothetical protein
MTQDIPRYSTLDCSSIPVDSRRSRSARSVRRFASSHPRGPLACRSGPLAAGNPQNHPHRRPIRSPCKGAKSYPTERATTGANGWQRGSPGDVLPPLPVSVSEAAPAVPTHPVTLSRNQCSTWLIRRHLDAPRPRGPAYPRATHPTLDVNPTAHRPKKEPLHSRGRAGLPRPSGVRKERE